MPPCPLRRPGLKVHVYRNLTKGVWSVRKSGRVIAHRPLIVLRDCKIRVSESGRQRAIREGQRNVHTWIEGRYCAEAIAGELTPIGYNPFHAPTFTRRPGFIPVFEALAVVFAEDGSIRRP
ncbi:hypothetical protein BB934_45845 (plasmid) [Microvirga ossetica]|uniref:Uncharacterized protein n=1 Tax=Microvirga ossetica TaxID=1882682 RepID=A0A1B2F028_9HYPH|nr:hypothetical protein BB934_45845 [Microvirga ossetica]